MSWHLAGNDHRMRPHGPPQLERVVAAARFPLYGVIDHPEGLTLQSVGYCGSRDQLGQPESILEAHFDYAYPPAACRMRFRLELTTTDPNPPSNLTMRPDGSQLPQEGDIFDEDGRLYTRYSSAEEALSDVTPARACVIEHFPLEQEVVVAELRHWTRPNPEWAFTLTRRGLRLDGRAWQYTQAELFGLLRHVGIVSDQPEVLAHYQRELAAWIRSLGLRADSA